MCATAVAGGAHTHTHTCVFVGGGGGVAMMICIYTYISTLCIHTIRTHLLSASILNYVPILKYPPARLPAHARARAQMTQAAPRRITKALSPGVTSEKRHVVGSGQGVGGERRGRRGWDCDDRMRPCFLVRALLVVLNSVFSCVCFTTSVMGVPLV